ncbi:Ribosomal protein L29 [Rickettsiales bacterium Ac37b]|nr:Ribosomal protein L29 [Rickettsiales bacterium Ac37b]
MKYSEIKTKDNDKLLELLLELKRESFNLRVQKPLGKLQNTARLRIVKRSIAKVKTLLEQRLKVVGEKGNA